MTRFIDRAATLALMGGFCAAACLVAGAASARPPHSHHRHLRAARHHTATMPSDNSTTASSARSGVNTTVTTEATGDGHRLVTNGPVPDTSANRAHYGQPMSNAGHHTQPAGN